MKQTQISDRMKKAFERQGVTFEIEELALNENPWEVGRSKDGGYIGPTTAREHWRWLARHGMYEPMRGDGKESEGCTCNIAKATKGAHTGKWIGWSHRAACAFEVGDMIFDASLLDGSDRWSDVPFTQVGLLPIVTDADAKQAAANFAAYVG